MSKSTCAEPQSPPAFSRTIDDELIVGIPFTIAKRLFDIVFSLAVFVLFSPLFLFIACVIRCSSEGKIFYSQPRLGYRGRVFRCYKFRTMHRNAHQNLRKLLDNNPALYSEWCRHRKLKNDPRIFSFGRFLRKTSLDELPQFWNVLLGDLSVVGPRPYMVSEKKEVGDVLAIILSVKPGITGIWQTSGRSTTSFHERIILDLTYVKKKSLLLDTLLVLKTIPQIFFSRNAY